MKKIVVSLLFVTFILTYPNYSTASDSNQIASNTFLEKDNDMKTQAATNTDFAFAIYGKLKTESNTGTTKDNIFISPYSISTALALVYGGARGETQKQMATALHFTLPDERLHPAFGTLQKQLVQENKSSGYQLLLANALWGQKGEPFLKEFLDITQNYYGAGLRQLDFIKETEPSRQIINLWVEEKTNKKIKDIIPPDGINIDTVLVLTNTIYFKGEWENKFARGLTMLEDFDVDTKTKVKVNMMYIQGENRFYEDEKLQVLELPYKEKKISMLLILPRDIEGITKIDRTLSAGILKIFENKMEKEEVEVYLPKFKIVWGAFSLNKALIALGMTDAFNPGKADFSGMNGNKDLFISDVFHKAFVEVTEEGTEAGAGAAVGIATSISPIFRADHPFIFLIKDNRTGSILFIGRVMNPSE